LRFIYKYKYIDRHVSDTANVTFIGGECLLFPSSKDNNGVALDVL
jgi:hypothetical protein